MTAADRWRDALAAWAIPPEILAQAPQSPWIHPPALFAVADQVPDSPSHARAREVLPEGGAVLDVGCGGGRAAFALVPPAAHVVGVDHQQGMLDLFGEAARRRGVRHAEHLGDWPEVAGQVPAADVAVCHHVAYNVAAITPFLRELSTHARRRVVLELPERHPLAWTAPLWQRFWGLERPEGPTADDLLAVLKEEGYVARAERWAADPDEGRAPVSAEDHVRFTRIRLCLPPERDQEVAEALAVLDPHRRRDLRTIWWDLA